MKKRSLSELSLNILSESELSSVKGGQSDSAGLTSRCWGNTSGCWGASVTTIGVQCQPAPAPTPTPTPTTPTPTPSPWSA
ncbi:hypothetical protein [Xanthocytophaga agilis]|uniref:Uncharacterized protein n=1 Tax=Xanthocytophaga agilis TaxID=3048010 RepID=A0AAE3R4Z4_9BACT|nr:hypothetical protein [Xanthocytophaga agilis]MDJ1503300.1 hypothetical protein [Xanthocytophaga agilis]